MDLDRLRLFHDVVRHGGFTAAARAANLDPSVVSRGIRALENDLGFRLFERSTRRVELSEAGAAYHARTAGILDDLEAAAGAARDLVAAPRGVLRISASTAFGQVVILPMLKAFRARYPDVTVELVLTDAQLDLIAERIDVAVRLAPSAPADMVAARLIATRYRVVAAPDYLKAYPVTAPEDLAHRDCLVFPLPGFRDGWRFREAGSERVVPVRRAVEISGALALAEAARMGLGIALLADWLVAEDLATGRLVDVFPKAEVTGTDFDTGAWVLYPSRRYLPLKTRAFIDALRDHLSGPVTGR